MCKIKKHDIETSNIKEEDLNKVAKAILDNVNECILRRSIEIVGNEENE